MCLPTSTWSFVNVDVDDNFVIKVIRVNITIPRTFYVIYYFRGGNELRNFIRNLLIWNKFLYFNLIKFQQDDIYSTYIRYNNSLTVLKPNYSFLWLTTQLFIWAATSSFVIQSNFCYIYSSLRDKILNPPKLSGDARIPIRHNVWLLLLKTIKQRKRKEKLIALKLFEVNLKRNSFYVFNFCR
jgi:hypothetical protein